MNAVVGHESLSVIIALKNSDEKLTAF